MSRTWKVQTHQGRKKARQVKSKVKSMLIIRNRSNKGIALDFVDISEKCDRDLDND
jgi:hypothetical protein